MSKFLRERPVIRLPFVSENKTSRVDAQFDGLSSNRMHAPLEITMHRESAVCRIGMPRERRPGGSARQVKSVCCGIPGPGLRSKVSDDFWNNGDIRLKSSGIEQVCGRITNVAVDICIPRREAQRVALEPSS